MLIILFPFKTKTSVIINNIFELSFVILLFFNEILLASLSIKIPSIIVPSYIFKSTDNLISQQQQQQKLNITKPDKNNNNKKIECTPLIQQEQKQNSESSLFQLNSNLLNHLFLKSTTATSNNNTLPNISSPFSNSIFNSFALQAAAAAASNSLTQNSTMQFYNNSPINNNNNRPQSTSLPQINNIFALNALAAHYNSTMQSQLITVKVLFHY